MSENFVDPINLLREWAKKKKMPKFQDNKLFFNNIWYSKDLKTRFISKNEGNYTLGAIWFVLLNQNEQYGNYFLKCQKYENTSFPFVSMEDFNTMIKYLNGESIDVQLDNNLIIGKNITKNSLILLELNTFKKKLENLQDNWGILNDKRSNDSDDKHSKKRLRGIESLFINLNFPKKKQLNENHIVQRLNCDC